MVGRLVGWWLGFALLHQASGSYSILSSTMMSCCHYCRSEPKHWVSVKGGQQIHRDLEVTKLNDPPAYLVGDEESKDFVHENRDYKLKYAGAYIHLKYENLADEAALIKEQYVQIDMAEPKYVGGVLTQGGYFEETIQGLFDYRESWVTQYVLSYSNSSDANFQLYKTETGITQLFSGNSDVSLSKLSSLVPPIVARYVRYHPLLAQDESGAVEKANVRVTAVTCQADVCATTRINCLLTEWSEWGECECQASCSQSRSRSVRRVQSCGGSRCGALKETQGCVPPEPVWKSAVQYGGIALGVLILIAIIGFVIYRKTHRDRVEVIVVKEHDDDDDDDRRKGPVNHPRPGVPPMGFGPPQPGAMRGPSMPPNFTGFGVRPPFGPGGPGMRPRFPPPGMGGGPGGSMGGGPPQAPPPGMPNINN